MNSYYRLSFISFAWMLWLVGCTGSGSSSNALPSRASSALVRFVDGAPYLETSIGGVPQPICSGAAAPCYLQVDGQSVSQSVYYGSATSFVGVAAGTRSLVARDEAGYAVGPLKTPSLSPNERYTLIVVGTYPNYSVLAFQEPASSGDARLSLYEASPAVPQSDFGVFRASQRSGFRRLGSASFGSVQTVTLGKSASNIGCYAGAASKPLGALTLAQINAFDARNELPFHNASRCSLFLFDPKGGSGAGPVFGSLDK